MISIAIGTHNEGSNLKALLSQLTRRAIVPEIIVVDDNSTNKETLDILDKFSDRIWIYKHPLNNDFAEHKNFMIDKCKGDFIFNVDADEIVPDFLLANLESIVKENDVDMFNVPRLNTVEGLTPAHVKKWGWNLSTVGSVQNVVNWPDYQTRIFRKHPAIRWAGKVHERIVGFQTFGTLPATFQYALQHHKTIHKQELQNSFYDKINRSQ